jgi:uncharacterized membrane protein
MFARSRLDALNDGIFAVAMTLLVLDIRLPDDFHPHTTADFINAIGELWPKILPYVLSFGVLGLRWLANLELRSGAEFVNRKYVNWWLFYLFLITCVPFSAIVVGRFSAFAPAIWLYVGHTLLIALTSMRLIALTPDLEPGKHINDRQTGSVILIISLLLAFAISFFSPHGALWALTLNFVAPGLMHLFRRNAVSSEG